MNDITSSSSSSSSPSETFPKTAHWYCSKKIKILTSFGDVYFIISWQIVYLDTLLLIYFCFRKFYDCNAPAPKWRDKGLGARLSWLWVASTRVRLYPERLLTWICLKMFQIRVGVDAKICEHFKN